VTRTFTSGVKTKTGEKKELPLRIKKTYNEPVPHRDKKRQERGNAADLTWGGGGGNTSCLRSFRGNVQIGSPRGRVSELKKAGKTGGGKGTRGQKLSKGLQWEPKNCWRGKGWGIELKRTRDSKQKTGKDGQTGVTTKGAPPKKKEMALQPLTGGTQTWPPSNERARIN